MFRSVYLLCGGIYTVIAFLAALLYASGIWLVLLTAYLTTLIDLQVDPLMVSFNAWVWERGWSPCIFGIPLSNFIGWFIVSLTITAVYIYIVKGSRPKIELAPLVYLYENSLYTVHTPSEASSIALPLMYGTVIVLTLTKIVRRKEAVYRHETSKYTT